MHNPVLQRLTQSTRKRGRPRLQGAAKLLMRGVRHTPAPARLGRWALMPGFLCAGAGGTHPNPRVTWGAPAAAAAPRSEPEGQSCFSRHQGSCFLRACVHVSSTGDWLGSHRRTRGAWGVPRACTCSLQVQQRTHCMDSWLSACAAHSTDSLRQLLQVAHNTCIMRCGDGTVRASAALAQRAARRHTSSMRPVMAGATFSGPPSTYLVDHKYHTTPRK